MRSAARAATLNLSCDPALGQAYLVPYKDEATLIPGWRGLRDMAYRTGTVAEINVDFLAEGQTWVRDQLTGSGHIEGVPTSNKPIGYFAYMKTLSGRVNTLYMTIEEIEAHKVQYAKGYKKEESAWNKEFGKMAKKTVLKQMLTQWAALDPLGTEVANLDYAVDSIDDMPSPEKVTVVNPHEGKSNNQLLNEMGYENDTKNVTATPYPVTIKSEPEPDPVTKAVGDAGPEGIMTIEKACKITNSEGVLYMDLDSETLSHMSNGIANGLKKPDLTPDKKQEYLDKQQAIKVILQARADGSLS